MISGKWGNLDDALRSITALGEELSTEEVLRPGLIAAGKELRDDIARTAPRSRDNKHMADAFVVKASAEEREFGRTTVLVGPSTAKGSVGFVAPFVEFGTSRMGSQPFVRPAFDGLQGWFPLMLADHLKKQYARVVRKYTKRAAK